MSDTQAFSGYRHQGASDEGYFHEIRDAYLKLDWLLIRNYVGSDGDAFKEGLSIKKGEDGDIQLTYDTRKHGPMHESSQAPYIVELLKQQGFEDAKVEIHPRYSYWVENQGGGGRQEFSLEPGEGRKPYSDSAVTMTVTLPDRPGTILGLQRAVREAVVARMAENFLHFAKREKEEADITLGADYGVGQSATLEAMNRAQRKLVGAELKVEIV